eukprot:gene11314-4126_t
MKSLLLSNFFKISKSLISHYSNTNNLSDEKENDLEKFLSKFDDVKDEEEDSDEESSEKEKIETKEEFENKKRKLTILLDQAVMTKMKVEKAFPEKLKTFGDVERFGLNWHPGWREPPRFIPDMDCDPYRGACSQTSCACDIYVQWPKEDDLYIYDPDKINIESELCQFCHHSKKYHTLETKANKFSLKEFSNDNLEKYSFQFREDIPKKHPSEIPEYELRKYYLMNPEYPGTSEKTKKMKMIEAEEKQRKNRKTLVDVEEDEDFL